MGLNRTGTDIGQGEWQITQSPAIAKQFLKDIKEGEKNPEDDSVQQYLDQILMALSALGKNFVKIVADGGSLREKNTHSEVNLHELSKLHEMLKAKTTANYAISKIKTLATLEDLGLKIEVPVADETTEVVLQTVIGIRYSLSHLKKGEQSKLSKVTDVLLFELDDVPTETPSKTVEQLSDSDWQLDVYPEQVHALLTRGTQGKDKINQNNVITGHLWRYLRITQWIKERIGKELDPNSNKLVLVRGVGQVQNGNRPTFFTGSRTPVCMGREGTDKGAREQNLKAQVTKALPVIKRTIFGDYQTQSFNDLLKIANEVVPNWHVTGRLY